MFSAESIKKLQERQAKWRDQNSSTPQLKSSYKTLSHLPVEQVYTPVDLKQIDYLADVGLPGEFPFLRGVHATGYRGKLWTMRMFAGFGYCRGDQRQVQVSAGERADRS